MYAKCFQVAAFLSALVKHTLSQTIITVDRETVSATSGTVAPAAELISDLPSFNSGEQGTQLFSFERTQLTDEVLANLTALQLSSVSAFAFAANSSISVTSRNSTLSSKCKTFPGDPRWPSDAVWDVFDLLLGGALLKTIPLASPCYENFGNYDEAKCAWLSANWANDSYYQTDDPTSVNAELFQNSTCLPPEVWPYDRECTLGSYPPYSVNVTNVAQVQLAVNLARNLDLRLVVKNTGHDFVAKSTGAGALNIWTHHLNDIAFFSSYRDATGSYVGPAVKAGAGVQAFELYAACHEYNVTCIGGEGKTVGVMGGYLQGGGHSPMGSLYGMGADQALSFEVVTSDGRFVTADEEQNADLFWALCGGGGGTFGVVTSVTVKAYPKMPVSFMTFTIVSGATGSTSNNITSEVFWSALQAYWDGFVTWTEAGTYSYFFLIPLGGDSFSFYMEAWWAPNMTATQLEALTAPLFANWSALGLHVEPEYQEFDNFHDAWDVAFPLELWGINSGRQASRLFPRDNWANETIKAESFTNIQSLAEAGVYVFGFHIAPGQHDYPDNAVNPAWRQAVGHLIMTVVWDETLWTSDAGLSEIKELSDNLTYVWNARWRELTPGSGAYLSESDYIEPNFQQAFWGENYPRLHSIKNKYDPYDLFWVQNGVGSEAWEVESYILGNLPSQAGKLCRV